MPTTGRQICSGRAWLRATKPFRDACALAGAPCALCGKPIDYRLRGTNRLAFSVDHKVPLWRNASDPLDPAGWQPAHVSCNSSRGATEGNRLRKAKAAAGTRDHYSRVW